MRLSYRAGSLFLLWILVLVIRTSQTHYDNELLQLAPSGIDAGEYIKNLSVESYMASLGSEEEVNEFKRQYSILQQELLKYQSVNQDNTGIRLKGKQDTKDDELIHQLAAETKCNRTKICDSMKICVEVCAPGTVQLSPWATNALATQRRVQSQLSLDQWNLPGSHNSAITKAHGYGLEEEYLTRLIQMMDKNQVVYIADQQFSLVDQFSMGARHIELDIHWYQGEIRICHAGGVHLAYLDELIRKIVKLFHIPIDWDSETLGCFAKNYRTLNQTFDEISAWIRAPENSQEIFIFMFDDQENLREWKKVHLIMDAIDGYFRDLVFTPPEKDAEFPKRWPTMQELQQRKKQIIFTSRVDYGQQMYNYIFPRNNLWSEFGPSGLQPYPVCSLNGTFFTNQGLVSRVLGDSLIYGPFYNGPSRGGVICPSNLPALMQCNVNFPCMDQLSPGLIQHAVWSWDEGQPSITQGPVCVLINSKGRWETGTCGNPLPIACRNTVDNSWKIPDQTVAGWDQGQQVCSSLGAKYQFGVPFNAFENSVLQKLANGQQIWINYNTPT